MNYNLPTLALSISGKGFGFPRLSRLLSTPDYSVAVRLYFNIKEEICQQDLKNIEFWQAMSSGDNVNKKFIKKYAKTIDKKTK